MDPGDHFFCIHLYVSEKRVFFQTRLPDAGILWFSFPVYRPVGHFSQSRSLPNPRIQVLRADIPWVLYGPYGERSYRPQGSRTLPSQGRRLQDLLQLPKKAEGYKDKIRIRKRGISSEFLLF